MINLLIQSKFRKYIKVGFPNKLPFEVREVIHKISNNMPVNGEVIKPSTEISIISGFIFGFPVLVVFLYFLFPMVTNLYYFLGFLFMFYYFAEMTFLSGIIFPLWVKKNIDKYFIYIGKEGIIKKNMYMVAFIPFDKLIGAKAYFGAPGMGRVSSGFVHLELIFKEGSLFNPALVKLWSFFTGI